MALVKVIRPVMYNGQYYNIGDEVEVETVDAYWCEAIKEFEGVKVFDQDSSKKSKSKN